MGEEPTTRGGIVLSRRALLLAGATVIGPTAALGSVIAEAALWRDGTASVFALRIPPGARFDLFPVPDPPRLVLDVHRLRWAAPALPPPTGVVRGVRAGLNRPGVTRVVLDLVQPVVVRNAAYDASSGRLLLRLEPAPLDVFLAQGLRGPLAAARAAPVQQTAALARPLPIPPAPPSRPPPQAARPLVVLDPGHGGRDPGAIGPRGTHEKHVVLAAARDLRAALLQRRRYRVAMTRDRDVFVPLADRAAFAQERRADLFLSIHADALEDRSVRGASVYTLAADASDPIAERLAAVHNRRGRSRALAEEAAARALIAQVRRETGRRSVQMARFTVQALARETTLLPRPHREAGFVVLKSPDVPSVLIELGFLSNREDEALLRRADHRRRLARAIAEAVDRHFAASPPIQLAG
ncbi:N-acetylmuramoyl-L-alanine amidase [Elioraea thermophila]|uniref:N-acetylmuramoyl-L-alanine amidase n=1 Tax=Elioraea thermophila TaxID=2185104 RepID=UPI000DF2A454|nr:N-acetylmuramoyl-L-alanine amidase [Elioraea thermophila]